MWKFKFKIKIKILKAKLYSTAPSIFFHNFKYKLKISFSIEQLRSLLFSDSRSSRNSDTNQFLQKKNKKK